MTCEVEITFPVVVRRRTEAPLEVDANDGTPIYFVENGQSIIVGTSAALIMAGYSIDNITRMIRYAPRRITMYTYYAPFTVFDESTANYLYATTCEKNLSFIGNPFMNPVGPTATSSIDTNLYRRLCLPKKQCIDTDPVKALLLYEELLPNIGSRRVTFISLADTMSVNGHLISGLTLAPDSTYYTGDVVNIDGLSSVTVTMADLGINHVVQTGEFGLRPNSEWASFVEPIKEKIKVCYRYCHEKVNDFISHTVSLDPGETRRKIRLDKCGLTVPLILFARRRNTFMFNTTTSDDVKVYQDGCCEKMCLLGDGLITHINGDRIDDSHCGTGVFVIDKICDEIEIRVRRSDDIIDITLIGAKHCYQL